ncbi:MAG TPA: BTAD domain-containing putative transcriptional regulator [Actinomycetota bacterium]|nr:BTAD domain-containing putative transcriptional regulator [Actinomycetota bacterium]
MLATRGASPGVVPAKIRAPRADGMRRLRLEEALAAGAWDRTLSLIAAPAGAGKTTLLAQCAAALGAPAAWYRVEESDGDARLALAYLEATLRDALPGLPGLPGGWASVEDAVLALEGSPATRVVLVVDDLHLLEGTPAAGAFEQLLAYRPPSLAVLAATRRVPSLALLTRLRIAGQLLYLGAEDLRFRSWEVERLFAEHYRQPLPPEEAGELARRTEGWAAGLQMFHLGTSGKTATERRQTLAALATRRLAREYLARNVLDDLPPALRQFLVGSCVLSRMSGPLCDALLGTTGSERCLQELERRQVFTSTLDTGGYRYHEALRAHLEGVLREELGPDLARDRYRKAGTVLEADGLAVDALQAYCRAEDWPSVERLLGAAGGSLAMGRGDWISLLPANLRAHDPWALLATARRLRAHGRWTEAQATYRLAEEGFGSQAGPQTGLDSAVEERLALGSWMEPAPPAPDWSGALRRAVAGDPLGALAGGIAGARGLLAGGLASLLAGDVDEARSRLATVLGAEDASPELAAGAMVAEAAAAALAGLPEAKELAEHASARAEELRIPWLARVGQAVLALTDRPDGRSEAAAARFFCQEQGDAWGASLAGLLEGLGELQAGGTHAGVLEQAAHGFAGLHAYVLEAWCLCARAAMLAAAADPQARAAADHAERQARRVGLRGPWALAYLALARIDGASLDEVGRWAGALSRDSGLALLRAFAAPRARTGPADPPPPPVRVQCFGGFSLSVGGAEADLARVKPRPRKLLHLLALHAGAPLHREVLIEALWPGADPRVGARNLHVAVSVLRQCLQSAPVSGAVRIDRDGEDYRLVPAAAWSVDVVELADLVGRARRLQAGGEQAEAVGTLTTALSIYRGELFPEDGPDDWVVRARERFRSLAVESACELADLLLAEGDGLAAARACELGLDADHTRDDLWRALEEAHELAGNHAAALAAHRRYEKVLADLGI